MHGIQQQREAMKPIRVILADDHPVVRAGVRRLLEGIERIDVVAEAEDGHQAILLTQEHQPDIVFMDISMPMLRGVEAAQRIVRDFPAVRVVILSVHKNQEYVRQALRAGAAAYLLKEADSDEYKQAIQAVMSGGSYLSPEVTRQVIEGFVEQTDSGQSVLDQLTSRQKEILQLIAEGKSNKEIAGVLHLSVKTVETHRSQMMKQLDIHEIASLTRFAIRTGLVSPDQ